MPVENSSIKANYLLVFREEIDYFIQPIKNHRDSPVKLTVNVTVSKKVNFKNNVFRHGYGTGYIMVMATFKIKIISLQCTKVCDIIQIHYHLLHKTSLTLTRNST